LPTASQPCRRRSPRQVGRICPARRPLTSTCQARVSAWPGALTMSYRPLPMIPGVISGSGGCWVPVPGLRAGSAGRACAGTGPGMCGEAARGVAGPAGSCALAAPGTGAGCAGCGRSCAGAPGKMVSSAGGRGQRQDRSAWRFCAPVLVL
jgi:hypothetical protein